MKNQTAPLPGLEATSADVLAAMGPESVLVSTMPCCGYPESCAAELAEAEAVLGPDLDLQAEEAWLEAEL